MTKIENTGRWFLIAACVIEGLYYGASAYAIFETERSLRAAFTFSELVQVQMIVLGFLSLLSLYCSFAIIQRHTRAKYFCVVLFVSSALWAIFVTLSYYSSDTDVLLPVWVLVMLVLLPTLATAYIFWIWNKTGFWRASQSS